MRPFGCSRGLVGARTWDYTPCRHGRENKRGKQCTSDEAHLTRCVRGSSRNLRGWYLRVLWGSRICGFFRDTCGTPPVAQRDRSHSRTRPVLQAKDARGGGRDGSTEGEAACGGCHDEGDPPVHRVLARDDGSTRSPVHRTRRDASPARSAGRLEGLM